MPHISIDMQEVKYLLEYQDCLDTQEFLEDSRDLFGNLVHSWMRIDEGTILHISNHTALSSYHVSNNRLGYICFEISVQSKYWRKIEEIENSSEVGVALINNSPSAEYNVNSGSRIRGIVIYCDLKWFMPKFPLDISQIPERSRSIFLKEYGSFDTLRVPLLSSTMVNVDQIINCALTGPLRSIFLNSKVNEILCALVAQINQYAVGPRLFSPGRSKTRSIEAAAAIYKQELHNPPTIEKLAERIGIDKRELSKEFQKIFGKTPHAFQLQQRMEHAELLLKEGTMSISEVGRLVGYQGYRTFVRAYQSYHDRPPSTATE